MSNDTELKDKDLQEVSGGNSEQNPVLIKGKIVSYCGNSEFHVELVNGSIISCKLDKKIKLKAISLIVGDTVKVKLDQDNQCKGIIVEI